MSCGRSRTIGFGFINYLVQLARAERRIIGIRRSNEGNPSLQRHEGAEPWTLFLIPGVTKTERQDRQQQSVGGIHLALYPRRVRGRRCVHEEEKIGLLKRLFNLLLDRCARQYSILAIWFARLIKKSLMSQAREVSVNLRGDRRFHLWRDKR